MFLLRAFDKHSVKSFSVVNDYDLNLNPTLKNGYGTTATKVACCGPCESAPVAVEFKVNKGN